METTTQDNQVAIIHNSIEVLKTGPEILQANQIKKNKAIQVGTNILGLIIEKGMDAELDKRANNYLANVNTANKSMKESRAGVTQIMDQLKKMYTEVENELDPKKEGTIPNQIQAERDRYAKKCAAEAEERRREAERVAAKATEAINIKAEAEKRIFNKYNDYLRDRKMKLQHGFNEMTLENFEEMSQKLSDYHPALKEEVISSFQLGLYGSYHTADEIKAFTEDIIKAKYREYAANYVAELTLLRDELVSQLASKKNELDEEKARKEEAEKIAKQQAEAKTKAAKEAAEKRAAELKAAEEKAAEEKRLREQEEQRKIDAEAAAAKNQEETKIDIAKQGEETMAMFEKEASIAEQAAAPEAGQGYEIMVLHPVGYTQIFALWFEHEGKNLPIDKIGNIKLDQMKAWAEKFAHKQGTKIESKFIQYHESFKAVNRKSK